MRWADLGQLPYAHPVLPTTFPQQNRGKKLDEKAHGPRERQGDRSPVIVKGKTDAIWEKKNYLNLLPIKVDLDGGKQKLNTLPSPWLFFPASTSLFHSQLLYLPTLTGVRGWGIGG